jgi:hypothetical protein
LWIDPLPVSKAFAFAEAVQRPTMKFVPTTTVEQLDLQAMHRLRERLVSPRTGMINQIRAFHWSGVLLSASGASGKKSTVAAAVHLDVVCGHRVLRIWTSRLAEPDRTSPMANSPGRLVFTFSPVGASGPCTISATSERRGRSSRAGNGWSEVYL